MTAGDIHSSKTPVQQLFTRHLQERRDAEGNANFWISLNEHQSTFVLNLGCKQPYKALLKFVLAQIKLTTVNKMSEHISRPWAYGIVVNDILRSAQV